MVIHVVRPGDTAAAIAAEYGTPLSQIVIDNGLSPTAQLVVGEALVIQHPLDIYTVRPGDTLYSISKQYNISLRQLFRNNPVLGGTTALYPGQTLVISYQGEKNGEIAVNGYAYPFVDKALLRATIPYLTYMAPFTYGITAEGGLVDLDDRELISIAYGGGASPLMHLSTLTDEGNFSNELAHLVLTDMEIQETLIENIQRMLIEKNYRGLDVDFEFVFAEDAGPYADFIRTLSQRLNPMGYPVITALAPKTSSAQKGLLYEGHNYSALGAAANELLLMTYEWGYTYGPPMAVAPLPNVKAVVEYALTEIPAKKLWLGIPNYGYDWPLPFVQGTTKATSISNQYAITLAQRYGAEIQYSEQAQSPFFRYTDEGGVLHEVWFEDARSIRAKLSLVSQYNLNGIGYWNLMRRFPQNWCVLNALYNIQER